MMRDRLTAKGHLRVDKYDAAGVHIETVETSNIFLTVGCNEVWALVTGQSVNTFTNASATIGIGDSAAAAVAGQVDLMAPTNTSYKPMSQGYPTAPSAGSVQFQAVFGSADANFVWNEFVIRQATSLICIDRGVQALGTKAAGTKWTATVTLSIS